MILTPFKTIEKEDNFSGLGISNIWSIKKKAQKDLTKDLKKDAQALQEYADGVGSATNKSEFFEQTLGKASKQAKDFAPKIAAGTDSVEGFKRAQQAAATATKGVGIASKVAAVGMKALNVAMNMGVAIVASIVIQKIVEYVSNIKSASEQAKEELDTANKDLIDVSTKIDGINSKIKDTDNKIDALKSKGTLTFVEKSQLTTLEKTSLELQTQLEIQQALQKLNAEKQTKAAIKSIDTQNEEKIDPFTGAVNTDNYIDAKSGMEGINQSLAFYSMRIKQVNKDQKEYNELLSKGNNLTEEEKQKKETLAYILKDDDSTTLKENLLNRAKAYQEEADAIDVNSVSNKEAAQERKQSALEQANAILKVVDAEQYAKNETIKFNSIWENDTFSHVKNDLSNLAKQGKLTADTLYDSKYNAFKTALDNVGISAKDTTIQINALTNGTSTGIDSANNTITTLKTLSAKFIDLNDKIVSLQSIQDQYNKIGYISADMLKTLSENNNELLQYIDIVNDNLVIHTEQLNNDADSIKAQMVATEQATLACDIFGIIQDNIKNKTAEAGNATDTAKEKIKDIDETMRNAAIGAEILAGGYSAVKDAFKGIPASNTDDLSADVEAKIEARMAYAKTKINAINKFGISPRKKISHSSNSRPASVKSTSSKSTENTALKNAEAELTYRKNMGEFTSDDLYKQIQLNQEYENATKALKKYAKTKDEIRDINVKIKNAQDTTIESQKNYQQKTFDLSNKELDTRIKLGKIEENSPQHLQNLLEIQNNLIHGNLKLINTDENRLALQEKIYDVNKAMLENENKKLQATESAVENIADKHIKDIQKREKIIDKHYQRRFDKAQNHIDDLKEREEKLEKRYKIKIDPIQEKINALQKINEEHEKEIALEKAKAAFEAAQNQKTVSIFRKGKGFVKLCAI